LLDLEFGSYSAGGDVRNALSLDGGSASEDDNSGSELHFDDASEYLGN